uniref:Ribonuclease H-like domain-containing protein n=1 Tax=Tanacetum cinerariifolium TaxID=118510 RepID=A0A699I3Z7_TANCI|nr:ribonuclease H-like domain-containing protein [Tanacetum cinerariifolium]
MTDYSLWEVILNRDSHVPTRIIEGVVQSVAPTIAEQKLSRKNESTCTTDSVSAVVYVSAVGSTLPASFLPNMAMLTMRTRRFLQKTGKNLGASGTASMGFDMSKVECYNCHRKSYFARECRSPKDQKRLGIAEPREGLSQLRPPPQMLWSLNVMVLEATIGAIKQRRSLQTLLLWLFYQTHLLIMRFIPSGGYHVVPLLYTGTFMPPKLDLVFHTAPSAETEHLAFNVQVSSTKPEQALSPLPRPSAPIIEDWIFNSEEDSQTQASKVAPSFAQSSEHVKSPRHPGQPLQATIPAVTTVPVSSKTPCRGPRKNKKACFVCKSVDYLIKDRDFHSRKFAQRTYAFRDTRKQYASLSPSQSYTHMVPTAVLPQSKSVFNTATRPISAALLHLTMTRPRHAYRVVTKSHSPIRRHLPCSPSSKNHTSPPQVTAAKAPVVSAAQGNKGTWVWRPKCPILDHDIRTTSASMTLKQFDYNNALGRSNQDKYIAEILRKFRLTEGKSASTPINTEKPLLKDLDGEDVDVNILLSLKSQTRMSSVLEIFSLNGFVL